MTVNWQCTFAAGARQSISSMLLLRWLSTKPHMMISSQRYTHFIVWFCTVEVTVEVTLAPFAKILLWKTHGLSILIWILLWKNMPVKWKLKVGQVTVENQFTGHGIFSVCWTRTGLIRCRFKVQVAYLHLQMFTVRLCGAVLAISLCDATSDLC